MKEEEFSIMLHSALSL